MTATIHDFGQDLAALEAAYLITFGKPLRERVLELAGDYGDRVDEVYCELDQRSTNRPVPCSIPVSVLDHHYRTEDPQRYGVRQNHIMRRIVRGYLMWNDRNGDYDDLEDNQLVEALAEVMLD